MIAGQSGHRAEVRPSPDKSWRCVTHDMFEAGASVWPVVLHLTAQGANATIDAWTLRKLSERRARPRSGRTDS